MLISVNVKVRIVNKKEAENEKIDEISPKAHLLESGINTCIKLFACQKKCA